MHRLENGEIIHTYLVTKLGAIREVVSHYNTGYRTMYQTESVPARPGYGLEYKDEEVDYFFDLYEDKDGHLYFPKGKHDWSTCLLKPDRCCLCGKQIPEATDRSPGQYLGCSAWPLYNYHAGYHVCDDCFPVIADLRAKLIEAQEKHTTKWR